MKRIISFAAIAFAALPSYAAEPPPITLTLTAQEAAQAVELFDKACIGSGSIRSNVCNASARLMDKIADAANEKKPSERPK